LFKILKSSIVRAASLNVLKKGINLVFKIKDISFDSQLILLVRSIKEVNISYELKDFNEKIRDNFHKLENLVGNLTENEKILKLQLGPDNELYSLANKCFYYNEKNILYKICPFGNVSYQFPPQ